MTKIELSVAESPTPVTQSTDVWANFDVGNSEAEDKEKKRYDAKLGMGAFCTGNCNGGCPYSQSCARQAKNTERATNAGEKILTPDDVLLYGSDDPTKVRPNQSTSGEPTVTIDSYGSDRDLQISDSGSAIRDSFNRAVEDKTSKNTETKKNTVPLSSAQDSDSGGGFVAPNTRQPKSKQEVKSAAITTQSGVLSKVESKTRLKSESTSKNNITGKESADKSSVKKTNNKLKSFATENNGLGTMITNRKSREDSKKEEKATIVRDDKPKTESKKTEIEPKPRSESKYATQKKTSIKKASAEKAKKNSSISALDKKAKTTANNIEQKEDEKTTPLQTKESPAIYEQKNKDKLKITPEPAPAVKPDKSEIISVDELKNKPKPKSRVHKVSQKDSLNDVPSKESIIPAIKNEIKAEFKNKPKSAPRKVVAEKEQPAKKSPNEIFDKKRVARFFASEEKMNMSTSIQESLPTPTMKNKARATTSLLNNETTEFLTNATVSIDKTLIINRDSSSDLAPKNQILDIKISKIQEVEEKEKIEMDFVELSPNSDKEAFSEQAEFLEEDLVASQPIEQIYESKFEVNEDPLELESVQEVEIDEEVQEIEITDKSTSTKAIEMMHNETVSIRGRKNRNKFIDEDAKPFTVQLPVGDDYDIENVAEIIEPEIRPSVFDIYTTRLGITNSRTTNKTSAVVAIFAIMFSYRNNSVGLDFS